MQLYLRRELHFLLFATLLCIYHKLAKTLSSRNVDFLLPSTELLLHRPPYSTPIHKIYCQLTQRTAKGTHLVVMVRGRLSSNATKRETIATRSEQRQSTGAFSPSKFVWSATGKLMIRNGCCHWSEREDKRSRKNQRWYSTTILYSVYTCYLSPELTHLAIFLLASFSGIVDSESFSESNDYERRNEKVYQMLEANVYLSEHLRQIQMVFFLGHSTLTATTRSVAESCSTRKWKLNLNKCRMQVQAPRPKAAAISLLNLPKWVRST